MQNVLGRWCRRHWMIPMAAVIVAIGVASSSSATELGGKVGVTIAKQRTDVNITSDARLGLRMGLYARWAVRSHFHVTGEVGYTQRGARRAHLLPDAQSAPNPEMPTDYRLDYITIPIVADLGVDLWNATLFGGAGPRVDILVDNGINTGSLGSYYDQFKSVVLGGVVAGGVRSIKSRVSVEFQYNWDVTNSYSDSNDSYFRSRAFDVMFGFAF